MNTFSEALAVLGLKASTVIFSTLVAVVAVLLDYRKHSFWTAILAVVAGVVVAVIMTDPIVKTLNLSGEWANAIAGILGISGRNLVAWVSKASKDPLELWDRWRGK